MRILLIHPPCEEEIYQRFLGLVAPPIGLAYVAAALENDGHEVMIIDMPAEAKDIDEVKEDIERFHLDVVGVYCATYRVNHANEVIKTAKEVDGGIKTLMGGPHASLLAEDCMKNENLDVVVCGEGEITTPELIHTWKCGGDLTRVKGIVFREHEQVVRNPPRELADVDSLPYPARHLLPMDKYKLFGTFKLGTMISSRGCTYGCHYCSVAAIYGRRWRPRNPKRIVDEMEYLQKNYDIDALIFMDDNFDLNKKRVMMLCDEIRERGLDILWGYQSASVIKDEETLKKLRNVGCRILTYSIETSSRRSIDVMKKKVDMQQVRDVFQMSRKLGMIRIANIILGLPGEAKKDVEESIELAKALDPEYALFFLPAPYPGTKFYETAEKMGMIKELDWSKYDTANPIIETEQLSLDELRELNKRAYMEFYLRPAIIKNNLKILYDFIKEGYIKPKHVPGLMSYVLRTSFYLARL
ncbi:MAG: radical SAM protein [Methanocellales archaeon]|nr:radical SAM protein [Methanocellales archaeon]